MHAKKGQNDSHKALMNSVAYVYYGYSRFTDLQEYSAMYIVLVFCILLHTLSLSVLLSHIVIIHATPLTVVFGFFFLLFAKLLVTFTFFQFR